MVPKKAEFYLVLTRGNLVHTRGERVSLLASALLSARVGNWVELPLVKYGLGIWTSVCSESVSHAQASAIRCPLSVWQEADYAWLCWSILRYSSFWIQ